jgi:hypothetical protein
MFAMTPRRLRRRRILVIPPSVKQVWLFLLANALYMTGVGWVAAQDMGDPAWGNVRE